MKRYLRFRISNQVMMMGSKRFPTLITGKFFLAVFLSGLLRK
jgi:hypothetical protein